MVWNSRGRERLGFLPALSLCFASSQKKRIALREALKDVAASGQRDKESQEKETSTCAVENYEKIQPNNTGCVNGHRAGRRNSW